MFESVLLVSSIGLNLSSMHLNGGDFNEVNTGWYLKADKVELGSYINSYYNQTNYITYNFTILSSGYLKFGSFFGVFDYSESVLLGGFSFTLRSAKLKPVIKYVPIINVVTFQMEYKL